MGVATLRRPIGKLARHPRAWATLSLLLLVAGPGIWWSTQLWGLPDVGDPFDVAAFEAEVVPDERNAFVAYREATLMAYQVWNRFRTKYPNSAKNDTVAWSKADQPWRDLMTEVREALALWRVGSEKPDARHDHSEGLSYHTSLDLNQRLRMLSRFAILEGSRLESEGDMAGAWGWYCAVFRSSRHGGRHGFLLERVVGAAIHDGASQATTRWAADLRVDAPLLRRALDELIALDAATPPLADALKMEYLVFAHSLNDPQLIDDLLISREQGEPADWCQDLPISNAHKVPIQAARLFLANDRERSLRVVRLMTANWLAQVDKPPSQRAPLAHEAPPIYQPDPVALASSKAIPPEALARWLDSSLLARRIYSFQAKYAPAVDRERNRQARLVVHLASELYRREHGQPPPSPQALLGPYLKTLPEGFDAPIDPLKP